MKMGFFFQEDLGFGKKESGKAAYSSKVKYMGTWNDESKSEGKKTTNRGQLLRVLTPLIPLLEGLYFKHTPCSKLPVTRNASSWQPQVRILTGAPGRFLHLSVYSLATLLPNGLLSTHTALLPFFHSSSEPKIDSYKFAPALFWAGRFFFITTLTKKPPALPESNCLNHPHLHLCSWMMPEGENKKSRLLGFTVNSWWPKMNSPPGQASQLAVPLCTPNLLLSGAPMRSHCSDSPTLHNCFSPSMFLFKLSDRVSLSPSPSPHPVKNLSASVYFSHDTSTSSNYIFACFLSTYHLSSSLEANSMGP